MHLSTFTKAWLAGLLLTGIGVAGCSSSTAGPAATTQPGRQSHEEIPSAPITNTDPCASRLHDLSGNILLFQLMNGRLPTSMAELAQLEQGPAVPPPVCPVSDHPYVYRPTGIFLQDRGEYVILYDPAPSHSGMRWAVTYSPATPTSVPVTKVIALPESFFLLHPPN